MARKIYRSSYPDIELPDEDLVTHLFKNQHDIPSSQPIYINAVTTESRTVADIHQRTKSLASGLRSLGVKSCDVVALFSPNTIDYAITCYAILGCAATVSPVNAASTPTELAAQLTTSTSKYLIVHSSLLSIAQSATKLLPSITLIQADENSSPLSTPTALYLATHSPADPLTTIPANKVKSHLAFLCFSSGTTGAAKGVMTTHHNIVSNVLQWKLQLHAEFGHSQNMIGFLPFSHIYGLNVYICHPLVRGSTVYVMPRFDLPLYLSLIQTHRPEQLIVVPPVVLALVKDPMVAKYDLSSVKRFMSGAAPLSNELREAAEKRFRELYKTDVYGMQAWGMTETSPLGTAITTQYLDKRSTVGNLAPNMSMCVVDPDTLLDCELAPDSKNETVPGELWVCGPNVASGYYRNPKATADATYTDEEGNKWFRTGDIGTLDSDGFLTIVDRIKEMIKYKGFQVIPSELEGKLLEHPEVDDVCVVGIHVEAIATEVPVGFITVKPATIEKKGKEAVQKEVKQWLESRVANHKKCRGGIYVVSEVPKSPSGKILRRLLKKEWEETVRRNVERGMSKL
jgi:acyl-CoA synthetase (AMP-forming)/AMP-acid ligase II